MQSSAVEMRQSLTVTRSQQSMSMPSPLWVWKPVRTLWIHSPRADTCSQPWKKHDQYDESASSRSCTRTSRDSTK